MGAFWSFWWLFVPSGLLQACNTYGLAIPVLLRAAGVPGCRSLLETLRAESLAGSCVDKMSSTSFCSSDRACCRRGQQASLGWSYAMDTTFIPINHAMWKGESSVAPLIQLVWLHSPCLQLPAANSRKGL